MFRRAVNGSISSKLIRRYGISQRNSLCRLGLYTPISLQHHTPMMSSISKRHLSSKETKNQQLQELKSTIEQKLSDVNWSISDLMAVWGTLTLFTLILVGPSAIQEMKKSNSDSLYEDLIDSEDVTMLTKQVLEYVHEAHNDEDDKNVLVNGVSDVVSKVLATEVVKGALQDLVVRVLASEEVKAASVVLVKQLFRELIDDPTTLEQLIILLNKAIQDPIIKQSLLQLIIALCEDETVKSSLKELLVRLGKEEEVIFATKNLLTTSAHHTLSDPDILDHSMEFAANIVGDDVVQRTSGEALRNAIRFSVTPDNNTLLVGVALMLASIYLFTTPRIPFYDSFISLHPYNIAHATTSYLKSIIPSITYPNYSMQIIKDVLCMLNQNISCSNEKIIIIPYIYPDQIITVVTSMYNASASYLIQTINKAAIHMNINYTKLQKYSQENYTKLQKSILLFKDNYLNQKTLQYCHDYLQDSISTCNCYVMDTYRKSLASISKFCDKVWRKYLLNYILALYSLFLDADDDTSKC